MTAKKPPAKPAAKAKRPKLPRGRPTSHSPKMAEAICHRLMQGYSLRSICLAPGMPPMGTVMRWIHDDTGGFREQYTRAREVQAEVLAEETLDIADDDSGFAVVLHNDEGVPVTVVRDAAEVSHRKLRIDVRRWYASQVAAKRFGGVSLPDGGGAALMVIVKDLTGRKDQ